MLVPQNRLLVLVAVVALPLAVAGGLRPGWSGIAVAGGAVVGLVAAVDAWLGARRAGRGLTFTFPDTLRLTKGRAGTLPILLGNTLPGARARRLRLGLALPGTVDTPREEVAAALSAGVARTRLEWPLTGWQRGSFSLAKIYFEERSPLGLWAMRRAATAGPCELRVYPDLRAEQHAAAMFLAHGNLGSRARRQVGRGREFEKLRDYVPGDSIQDISWKATARRQRPVSKVFQIERTQEVYVILDCSRMNARPAAPAPETPGDDDDTGPVDPTTPAATGATVLERYVSAALLLCLAAERQGDLFGLATFAGGVGQFLRARNGVGHFHACREAIYALEPQEVSPDFDEICAFLRGRLRRRALLVFLTSSLEDPVLAESFTRAVEPLSRQHLVRVSGVRPAGAAPLFSGRDVRGAEDVYRRLGGHLRWQQLRERENLLRRLGVGFALLDPARLTAEVITQYLEVKGRQIL